jgi:hypothetical protein
VGDAAMQPAARLAVRLANLSISGGVRTAGRAGDPAGDPACDPVGDLLLELDGCDLSASGGLSGRCGVSVGRGVLVMTDCLVRDTAGAGVHLCGRAMERAAGDPLAAGCTVEIASVTTRPELNGQCAVSRGGAPTDSSRCTVQLQSGELISLKRSALGPPSGDGWPCSHQMDHNELAGCGAGPRLRLVEEMSPAIQLDASASIILRRNLVHDNHGPAVLRGPRHTPALLLPARAEFEGNIFRDNGGNRGDEVEEISI